MEKLSIEAIACLGTVNRDAGDVVGRLFGKNGTYHLENPKSRDGEEVSVMTSMGNHANWQPHRYHNMENQQSRHTKNKGIINDIIQHRQRSIDIEFVVSIDWLRDIDERKIGVSY